MQKYFEQMRSGEILQPLGVSVSGALAILHRAGPSALSKWAGTEGLFDTTRELFRAANGVF
jgi:hypothetical protein